MKLAEQNVFKSLDLYSILYSASYGKKPIFLEMKMSLVMRKPAFCICENKDADQLCGNRKADTAKLISAFVFATQIIQSIYYLNSKFQASSHLLWLYSLVSVGQGRKPERWFSHDA